MQFAGLHEHCNEIDCLRPVEEVVWAVNIAKLETPEKRFASLGQTQQRTRWCRQAEITVMQQPAIRLSQAGRCS
jgi:hypothetical protein